MTIPLVVAIIAALVVLYAGSGTARANHNVEVGVDVDSTGNSASALGSIQNCRVVSFFQTFNIDIYIKRVSNLIASEAYFQYDATKLEIQSKQIMFQNQAGSTITDVSETLPDTTLPGVYRVGAVETGQLSGDSGDGVLVRLSVKAIGTGLSATRISKMDVNNDGEPDLGITLTDKDANHIGDTTDPDPFFDGTVANAAVFVGSGTDCSADTDSDGVQDATDNCPTVANSNQADWNFDGIGNVCQDFDSDGLLDANDNCPGVSNANQANMDGDALGDACDPDKDGDGVNNDADNCLSVSNASQTNTDAALEAGGAAIAGDSLGDACDDDDDNDSWPDSTESYLTTVTVDDCMSPPGAGGDAYPLDIQVNSVINSGDVLQYLGKVGKSTGQLGSTRLDLQANTIINSGDVLQYLGEMGSACN